MRLSPLLIIVIVCLLHSISPVSRAQTPSTVPVCPAASAPTPAPVGFGPGGIILTSFDRSAMWVFNIDNGQRYPLPETTPCGRNCRLSPDGSWITYFNQLTNAFNRMRLDGTERALIVEYAADVGWWTNDTYLIWTPGGQAYLRTAGTDERRFLDVDNVIAVQPGGNYGVVVTYEDDRFYRALLDLQLRGMAISGISDGRVMLGEDRAFFNALAWSPNGAYLAYVAPILDAEDAVTGSELYGITPGDAAPSQWTDITSGEGSSRINGLAVGELSWSPDSTRIAYWVMPLSAPPPPGSDPAATPPTAGDARIHILDVRTGEDRVYCTFSTPEHTPNPPRLVWSPDGTYVAFAGNIAGDDRSYLLLALDVTSGALSVLSEGVYPALGLPDVVAWGRPAR